MRVLANIPVAQLRACAPRRGASDLYLRALVRSVESFLDQHDLIAPASRTASEGLVAVYREHLTQVRGLATSTLKNHCDTASSLLAFLKFDGDGVTLRRLDSRRIEAFLVTTATRRGRAALQQSVAHLRSFLRFLVSRGDVVPGLDASIDTPRLYRGEQLPRALAWDVVQAFLGAIERSTPRGQRDYAMLLLLATYGLRVSEVAALRLDDLAWRTERIRVPRPKVSAPLVLPLTVEVGAARGLRAARSAEGTRPRGLPWPPCADRALGPHGRERGIPAMEAPVRPAARRSQRALLAPLAGNPPAPARHGDQGNRRSPRSSKH